MSAEEANDTQNMEKILEKEIAKKQESNGANSSKDENKESFWWYKIKKFVQR